MPGKGKQSRGHRGGRSRGRGAGRGGFGGGGRGRNRDLIATSLGYVYRLESNVDQFNDDFRVYGQFSSDEEDSEIEMIHTSLKKRGKKSKSTLKKENRLPLETSYLESDDRAACCSSSSQNDAAAATPKQFAKGKSKYLKSVLFTKSSSVLNSTDENSADENQDKHEDKLAAALADISLDETATVQPASDTLWSAKKRNVITVTETVDFEDFADNHCESAANAPGPSNTSKEVTELVQTTDAADSDDDDAYGEQSSSDNFNLDDEYEEEDYYNEYTIDEVIHKLLTEASNAADNDDDDLYDYAILDQDSEENDLSDEEAAVISSYKNFHQSSENVRKKKSHRTRDDNAIVDPEIFGQSLHAALADVPKPGSRKWDAKQQRKENRKKKKEEAKKEKKKKNRSKPGTQVDNAYPHQLSKIDERIRDFIVDDSITSFQFAPMAAHLRRQIHILAAFYNLKSKSGGTGEFRCTMISKTNETYIPTERRNIERFLSDSQVNVDEQTRIIEKNRKRFANTSRRSTGSSSSTPKTKPKANTNSSKSMPTVGSIVAFDAPPINEDNVGHRMLAAMGWKQGDALGSTNNGITAPIEAVIRKKNQGLGS